MDIRDKTVSASFQKQVNLFADRVAIKTETHEITYGELDSFSNSIGKKVSERLEERQKRIALILDHDVPLIAAILGTLKAGNIFVVIDPEYPSSQIEYMLANADIDFILTDNENELLARQLVASPPVCNVNRLNCKKNSRKIDLAEPGFLAYIMYTSGSTGTFKGVTQTHRNLLQHVYNYAGFLDISHNDRLTLFYSCSFSASLMDIFGALLNGATLYPHYLKKFSLTKLHKWLRSEKITVLHTTPSILRRISHAIKSHSSLDDIRIIDVAGEPLFKADVELYRKVFPKECHLVNHLACTEASVIAQYLINEHTEITSELIPIGLPANGIQLKVLNNNNQPVPTDTIGELVVYSQHISPGYWKSSTDLTTIDNVPSLLHKHSNETDCLQFHMGDLGKMDSNGCFFHLGRKGTRVKIRGYSIEITSVEAAICSLKDISDAAVSVIHKSDGDAQLAAYYVSRTKIKPHTLRAHLENIAPHYMIPSFMVELESLPVTSSGKTDKQSLPDITREILQLENRYVGPNNPIESKIQKIWEKFLNISPIGINDAFSDLGGDSLSSISLLLEIEKEFSIQIPLSIISNSLTISSLARNVKKERFKGNWDSLVLLNNEVDNTPIFCVHGAGDGILGLQQLAKSLDQIHPFYGIQPSGLNGTSPLHKKVEDFALFYCDQIERKNNDGPFILMGYSFGAMVAYEMAGIFLRRGSSLTNVFLLDPPQPGALAIQGFNNFPKLKKLLKFFRKINTIPSPQRAFRLSRYKLYSLFKQPLPLEARFHFFAETSFLAARRYKPIPFDGNVVLVESEEFENQFWTKLIDGYNTVYSLNCEHENLLKPPNVQKIVQIVKEEIGK